MKRFLTYTWPLFAYFILMIGRTILEIQLLPSEFYTLQWYVFISPTQLLLSLGGIYYLRYSPFSSSQTKSLSILLILRLIVHCINFGDIWIINIVFIGIDIFILLLYWVRTFHKDPRLKGDYIKLGLFSLALVFLLLTYFSRLPVIESWIHSFYEFHPQILRYYISGIGLTLEVAFILLHITLVLRLKHNPRIAHTEKLIDEMGEDHRGKY